MNGPVLSIIVVWNSCDTIQQMLQENRFWFAAHDLEILIVNCGGDSKHLRQLVMDSRVPRTGIVSLPEHCNHGLAVNIGMQFSRAPNLLVLGSGHVLQSDFVGEITRLLNGNVYVLAQRILAPNVDTYWKHIREQSGAISAIQEVVKKQMLTAIFSDGTEIQVESMSSNMVENSKSGASILAVKKRDLGRIGGYHSDIQWGEWVTADVQLRLQKLSRLACVRVGDVRRLSDTNGLQLESTQSLKNEFVDLHLLCERYARGDMWGTYSRDAALWRDRVQLERLTFS